MAFPPPVIHADTTGSPIQFRFTPRVAVRTAAASGLIAAGMYYLATGKRNGELGRMVTGAVLILASLLFL